MAEATSQLSILVRVRDEAGAALSRLSNDVSDLGGSLNFTGLKAGVLAGALAAISSAAILGSIKAFADAEVKMAQFDATLKTLPESLQKYREGLLVAADNALKFGFDNEQAALSMARFLQATGDVSFTMQAFQAAMDLSRAKGISLEQATQALILAFQGGGRLLKQFGIEVDEHASKETILQAVIEKTRGSAEAYAGTLTGMIEILKVYIGEIAEAIGQPFAEFIKENIKQLTNWIEKQGGINALLEKFQAIIVIVGALLVGVLAANFAFVAATVLTAMGALGTLNAILFALIGVGALLYTVWRTNFLGIRDIVLAVVDAVMHPLQTLKSLLDSIISSVQRFASSAGSTISSAFGSVRGFLGLQHGGIVTRPTLAMVGEAGAEAVIPLSRLGGAGIGGGINIYLQGDFYTDTETAERFANKIANLIKFQLKL